MTRKKRGFWTFIFSLMPGAGEMYLGFMKRGVSTMLVFLGWLTFCGMSGFDVGIILVSVIWFYSFFTVHNLVSLPDEEFYQQEDDYILIHMDRIVGIDQWERGKVKFLAAALIIIGIFTAAQQIWQMLWDILPDWLQSEVGVVYYGLPKVVISLLLIALGIYLIRGKKKQLDRQAEVVYDMPQSEMQDENPVQDVTPDVIVLPDTKKENK